MNISGTDFIRWVATAGLIYMVGTETGPWTMAFCALIALAAEVQTVTNRMMRDMADLVALLIRRLGNQ